MRFFVHAAILFSIDVRATGKCRTHIKHLLRVVVCGC